MAAGFTQDSVLQFLQSRGGSVKNADLLLHFRGVIRESPDRENNRELFKRFVNSLATVQQLDGVSYVVLRKKFRGNTEPSFKVPPGKRSEASAGNAAQSPAGRAAKSRQNPPVAGGVPGKGVLPAAGIIPNNEVEVHANLPQQQLRSEVSVRPAGARLQRPASAPSQPAPAQPERPAVRQHVRAPGPPPESTPETRGEEQCMQVPVALRGQIPAGQAGVSPSPQAASRHRHRKSYKSAVSHDDDDDEDTPVGPVSAGRQPLGSVEKALSSTSPCIMASPAPSSSPSSSSERTPPEIYIQDVKGEKLPSPGLDWTSESDVGQPFEQAGLGLGPGGAPWELGRRSLPAEARSSCPHQAEVVPQQNVASTVEQGWLQAASGPLEPSLHRSQSQRTWLSSSQNSIFAPPGDAGISRGLDRNSSLEELQNRPAETWGEPGILETLQRSRLCVTRHSSDHLHVDQEPWVRSWQRSTGHLHTDQGDSESSDGSIFSPHLRKRPAELGRVSGSLRGRMCLSLGADLDQLLQEEAKRGGAGGTEAARLNRLNLISSSLSLPHGLSTSSLSSCSTPPRCQSLSDLLEGGGRSNSPAVSAKAHNEDHVRQSVVPLEAREHAWMVKGAAGAWPDIYSLFRDDSSLLNRRDFISGFTVLHWIAKHGDHRVLNTLWYGVEKAGLSFDINARSTSGHTPLHIASIHGHKNIMRLLVNKFRADVLLRDTAGKKAWQYLSRAMPVDVFQLLGAPPRAALSGQGQIGTIDTERPPARRQNRRRRHHFSSASPGSRHLSASGNTKVKRSSSLAAFLKHKSLNLYQAQQMNSPV